MDSSTPFSGLSLSASELAAIPASTAIALAEALAALGRPADALSCALDIRFELAAREHPDELSRHFSRLFELARSCSPGGAGLLMDRLAERQTSMESPPSHLSHNHAISDAHRAVAGPAFERAARERPSDAMDLIAKAPAWVCLHHIAFGDAIEMAEGLGAILSGNHPLDLASAYLDRDLFCQRLVGDERSCQDARVLIRKAIVQFNAPPGSPAELSMSILLRKCIQAAPALPPDGSSPLPHGWIAGLFLGAFTPGREMALRAYGRAQCVAIARNEARLSAESRHAFRSGNLDHIARVFECFGAHDAIVSQQAKLLPSAVALMARSMRPDAFAQAIDLAAASGATPALEANCAHRFWAVFEQKSSIRKMGDALAYCAAEGLIEHAEILLDRMPTLDRKSVKEVLSYMQTRDSAKRLTSNSAWEVLLLREIFKARPEPAAPPRRSRL